MLFSWHCALSSLPRVSSSTRSRRNDGSRDLVHLFPNLVSLLLLPGESVTSPISKSDEISCIFQIRKQMFRVVKLVCGGSSLCPQIHLIRLSQGSEPLYITIPCVGKMPINPAADYLHLFFF